jgi:hypothetical protein
MRLLYCDTLGAASVVTMAKLVMALPPSPFREGDVCRRMI